LWGYKEKEVPIDRRTHELSVPYCILLELVADMEYRYQLFLRGAGEPLFTLGASQIVGEVRIMSPMRMTMSADPALELDARQKLKFEELIERVIRDTFPGVMRVLDNLRDGHGHIEFIPLTVYDAALMTGGPIVK